MNIELETSEFGAEITSLKFNGIEKIHQGERILDKDGNVFWKRHAPILFPIVGSLQENKTKINDKEYFMGQHGFARDMKFEVIEKSKIIHSYVLKSSSETFRMYPFDFQLYITYTINNNTLIIEYKVINNGNEDMSFGIGGHPAFICDFINKDSYVKFEENQHDIQFLQLDNGLIKDNFVNLDIIKEGKIIKLSNKLFENDAIIMQNVKGKNLYLIEGDKKILKFNFNEFPYLALWSKKDAPFVCIEPWYSIADKVSSDGIYQNKIGIRKLKQNESFECKYEIEFM